MEIPDGFAWKEAIKFIQMQILLFKVLDPALQKQKAPFKGSVASVLVGTALDSAHGAVSTSTEQSATALPQAASGSETPRALAVTSLPKKQANTSPSSEHRPKQAGNRKCARRRRPEGAPRSTPRADMSAPQAARLSVLGLALGLAAHQGKSEDSGLSGDGFPEGNKTIEEDTSSTFMVVIPEAFPADTNSTQLPEDTNQLEFMLMVLIPLILLSLLLVSVVLLATYYKRKRTKQEPSSQGSQSALQTCELGGESLKVPIFEEDTPSVMEIEMEELDKWMNSMNRNADGECLPTLKEEKESNHNPSDSES
ncbi:PREDICTED: transmembrane protein 154 [Chinchilla lanigera]|uniref:transmembrane protein 154 n=1 Tax=Chinchilla lanigera TaxID=34839 RepID=UPI000696A901|nr:PREDICTED: transmembrane protein 154 [Chinchilla lanigera]